MRQQMISQRSFVWAHLTACAAQMQYTSLMSVFNVFVQILLKTWNAKKHSMHLCPPTRRAQARTEPVFALIAFKIIFMFSHNFRLLHSLFGGFFPLFSNQCNITVWPFQCNCVQGWKWYSFGCIWWLEWNRWQCVRNNKFLLARCIVVGSMLLLMWWISNFNWGYNLTREQVSHTNPDVVSSVSTAPPTIVTTAPSSICSFSTISSTQKFS